MRAPRSGAARAALRAYRDADRSDRLHVRLRWWTCPIDAVDAAVPRAGDVLEVGCGHGLVSSYLAAAAPERTVVGVDVDAAKVAVASAAASRAAPGRLRFGVVRPGEVVVDGDGGRRFDAVVVVDVLYLLGDAERRALLDACIAHLADDGVLVVKETALRPRWKALPTRIQELVATRVLHITQGRTVHFVGPATIAAEVRHAGLLATITPVDRGYAHPHCLLVARRPPTPPR